MDTKKVLIILDPGHGGKDPGAVFNGLQEASFNLSIALKIRMHLEKLLPYAKVLMTRETDVYVSLADRVAFCNYYRYSKIEDVFFVSIHCNAALSDTARGMEVYVSQITRRSQLSDRMASSISSFLKRAGWRVRSRLNTDYKQANFYVLNHTFCPAVLVENLFITNAEDRKLLQENWPELARLEAIGIAKFIKCL
jgi:N-acetylmuramoyl-L-alanine amidase